MQTNSGNPRGGAGVVRNIWIAAALALLAFLAVVGLAVDRASRVADEFALGAEKRMAGLVIDEKADAIVRQVNEIANWDDTVDAVTLPARVDADFVEENVAGWLAEEYDFAFVAATAEDGATRFAVADGQTMTGVTRLRQLDGVADLAELGRKRYEQSRIATEQGYIVPYPSGADTPRIEARAWRMFDGKPSLVVAQVITPESQEKALGEGQAVVLIAVRPMAAGDIAAIGDMLGVSSPAIVAADAVAPDLQSIAMAANGAPGLAFAWRPRAPRPAVLAATAPFAVGLCLVCCAFVGYIVRRHTAALAALAKSEEENRFLATHDTLTRLANRAHFDRELGGAFSGMEKSAFAVLCIDLDRFKAVNDTHGHHAGDAVLREVAARFRARMGERGLVARTGGDEFIALVRDGPQTDDLIWLAEGFIEDASTPVYFNGALLQIGASVGIAVAPDDGRNPRDIIHAADMALYLAKQEGRGTARRAGADWTTDAAGVMTRAVA